VDGRAGVKMAGSGVDFTDGNWSEVWTNQGAEGSKYNDHVFAIDTNRGGGQTGGVVGISFSPGWTGHQNWGIYALNKSGGSATQGYLVFVRQLDNASIAEVLRLKADKSATFAGDVVPLADGTQDLGAADKRWNNIYTTDLQLANEGSEGNEVDGTTGSWTIQEGDEDLYLLNRKSGKKYKFNLTEIE